MRELFRLAALIRPHWRRALLGLALALATLLANMALLALSSWFIATMALAGLAGVVIDYTLPATGVRALAIVRAAGRYVERLVNHDTTFRILGSLRLWFYRRIEPLAPARLVQYRSGDLLSRIRADIDTLDDFYVRGLIPALVAALALACIIPFLAHYDMRLAWIDAVALLAAGAAAPALLAGLAAAPGRQSVEAAAELRAVLVEELEGMAELIALGAAEDHARGLDLVSNRLDAAQRRLSSLTGLGDAALVAGSSLAVWGSAYVLVGLVAGGILPKADLAMLSVLVLASFEAVMPLPTAIQKAGEMAQAARRLFDIIDAEPAIAESASPGREASAAPRPAEVSASAISIRGLRFRYAPGLPPVFDAFDLELPRGGRLGIVGPSGCGKSSLLNVLLRFWEFESGRIEILGQELRGIPVAGLRRQFAVVPQSPFLYHASIRDNLLVALRPEGGDARGDDEERMREALEAARLGDLLRSLPEGLDSTVGETGRALSVGEAQRLALARAFLKDAPIILLDEPTEGLDDRTADELLSAIASHSSGRSLVLISHRERDMGIVDRVQTLRP
ncbi:MAG TPA: thiol reductant ABC exporter subunit CydC [Rectinemataceae bacterium]|nr:thiol reductant ABC exporter subunit CydC [Rectinemataceae bacterium]